MEISCSKAGVSPNPRLVTGAQLIWADRRAHGWLWPSIERFRNASHCTVGVESVTVPRMGRNL